MERNEQINPAIDALIKNVEKVIIGKRDVIELVITAMFAKGHILVEDVPGVGKTQLVSALSASCGGTFGRVQMTPDIMPSDITGFSMINTTTNETSFKKGTVFCNFFLADEINRASPKSQSALLEVMEERQVSIDGNTYQMASPFMVLATQNPVETYGTYHLPEAQMDRFIMKISVGYPGKENELAILRRDESANVKQLESVVSCEDIERLIYMASQVRCAPVLEEYIVNIVEETRHSQYIKLGASPRASIALHKAAKAYALIKGRDYVLPDDIKYLAPYVLEHRIMLSSKGRAVGSNEENVKNVLDCVEVPV